MKHVFFSTGQDQGEWELKQSKFLLYQTKFNKYNNNYVKTIMKANNK